MNRHQRLATRSHRIPGRIADYARSIERAMTRAGVPDGEMEAFLDWTLAHMWDHFKEERMNRRIIIENEVRSLGLRLPNGTVRKEYSSSFRLPVDLISDIELLGADDLGLHLDVADDGTCTLSGLPSQPGDFQLRLRYRTIPGEPASELLLPIAFNPNPRDLWVNKPTNPHIPYPKPDSDCAYVMVEAGEQSTPRKDMVAASQRGRSHAQEGKPRDDHFALHHCDRSDWYIMAVADGAGSAKYSRKGSEVACETVITHCREKLQDNPDFEEALQAYALDRDNIEKRTALTKHVIDIVYNGALKAHEAIKEAVMQMTDSKLKDFATTLMFAICKKYDFGWFIASFWVGDGAMCIYDAERGTAKLLGTPDEGEFSGQTRFLTMPEIFREPDVLQKRLRMAIVDDFTALFLMSDGVSDPMFETERNLTDPARWEEFYRTLRNGFPADAIGGVDLTDDNASAKEQLLGWLDFWSPGNHDDRTIAILY